jgi:hypothetical protein
MNHQTKIILALDAILCASEGFISDPELRDAISDLQDTLEARAPQLEKEFPTMDEYVRAQAEALESLLKDPRVFGHYA